MPGQHEREALLYWAHVLGLAGGALILAGSVALPLLPWATPVERLLAAVSEEAAGLDQDALTTLSAAWGLATGAVVIVSVLHLHPRHDNPMPAALGMALAGALSLLAFGGFLLGAVAAIAAGGLGVAARPVAPRYFGAVCVTPSDFDLDAPAFPDEASWARRPESPLGRPRA
jgi:hypothetical protein